MAYGKIKTTAPKPARLRGAYPRTITFSGPKSSKRSPLKSQSKKLGKV